MTGWDTDQESWDKAVALADSLGLDQDDLFAGGRRYMAEHWQEADPNNETQLRLAVGDAHRLRLLEIYLADIKATKE